MENSSSNDTWYFAYGSNLSIKQKKQRTGPVRRAELCLLPDYRLAFNKRGRDGQCFANICADVGEEVWGISYLCSEAALLRMDRWEGASNGDYYRTSVRVFTRTQQPLDAIAYIAGSEHICAECAPTKEYLDLITSGARQNHLPSTYIQAIEVTAKRLASESRAI